MEKLLQHIQNFYPLGNEALAALDGCFEEIVLSKNDLLLAEGKICKKLYFLEKGAVRGFYLLDGKEVTHWFGFENDFITSFHSFITGEPAVENIQLLEGSILWGISRDTLTGLYDRFHEIERLVRIAYEKYYIKLEERFVNGQFKTAAERYAALMERSPHILERVSLGQVASYLGISQETLSRVRNRF